MRRVVLAILASVSMVGTAIAGPLAPHLIPLDPSFEGLGPLKSYMRAVRRGLLGFHNRSQAQVLVLPSFKNEWALYISRPWWPTSSPQVVLARTKTSFWVATQQVIEKRHVSPDDAVRSISIETEELATPITGETADLVERAWAEMLARARRPETDRFGLDGTGYFFIRWEWRSGHLMGYAWSPKEDTATHALTALTEALRDHASGSHPREASEALAKSKARHLLELLGSTGQTLEGRLTRR